MKLLVISSPLTTEYLVRSQMKKCVQSKVCYIHFYNNDNINLYIFIIF